MKVACLSIALALSAAVLPISAQAVIRQYELNIPRQPLETALREFANQTGLQVARFSDSVEGSALVGPVNGTYSAEQALEALLSDRNLAFKVINERTIAVITETHSQGSSVESKTERVPIHFATGHNNVTELEEVLVTGTHIQGELSAGSTLSVIDRKSIDASGYGMLQDLLTTIPQNQGGNPSEDFNAGTEGNFNRGSGLNLRGLGADATLVLVNGRRQAIGGTEGAFVDISSIPTSAIERVELLTDGASAIYGSDAVGGVVNIVLRDDLDGAETRARYGVGRGDTSEMQVAQLFGVNWGEASNAMLGYQYSQRDALPLADVSFAATEDQRSRGGDDFRLFVTNPGNILDPITFAPLYAIPAGQNGRSLTTADLRSDLVNLGPINEGGDLIPRQRMHNAFFALHLPVSEYLSLRADGRYSDRRSTTRLLGSPEVLFVPSSNPFFVDPFGGSDMVMVAYNMGKDLGVITGAGITKTFTGGLSAELALSGTWTARSTVGYADEQLDWTGRNLVDYDALALALADPDPATAFNPFGDGQNTPASTIDAVRTEQRERTNSRMRTANVTVDGALASLPAGELKMAVGIDYREESLDRREPSIRELSRDVTAGYVEFAIPIMRDRAGARQLHLSLAGRLEEYSDFGSTFNPRAGITWSPTDPVSLRATWGTSFKAPRLADLYVDEQSNSIAAGFVDDPQSPTGQSFVLTRSGNNPDLNEETATTWTTGVDLRLADFERPSVSVTYFNIDFRDRIAQGGPPGFPSNTLVQEDQWREIVQRNPSQAEIDALCSSPEFFGDPAACESPVAAIIDFRLRNLGSIEMQGIDLSVAHAFNVGAGTLGLALTGTQVLHYRTAASDQSPRFDILDTVGNPLGLRMRGEVTFERDDWDAVLHINYAGSYDDNVSVPTRHVGSWATVDVQLGFATRKQGLLRGLECTLSAVNVFDREPPFVNSRYGYDLPNADAFGRLLSLQITKSW